MKNDIVPGASFPDYELPDHRGKKHKLSDLQEMDPVALVLARGGYCPKEHLQQVWRAQMEPLQNLVCLHFGHSNPSHHLDSVR
jgi:peroxiredoxin